MHIEESPGIWFEGSDGRIIAGGISGVPGVGVEFGGFWVFVAWCGGGVAEAVAGVCAGAAAVLPFGFRGEPDGFGRWNELLLVQFLGEFIAEGLGVGDGHHFDGVAGAFPATGVIAHDKLIKFLGGFVAGDAEGGIDFDSCFGEFVAGVVGSECDFAPGKFVGAGLDVDEFLCEGFEQLCF